ncbi:hypothetical protein EFS12_10515, partial [Levilactobacillus brevis]|nr:hypothetical protein [Levilactobacillus brevis]
QLLKDGFVVNTILKEADLFCPNSVRINFTIYLYLSFFFGSLNSVSGASSFQPRADFLFLGVPAWLEIFSFFLFSFSVD